MIGVDIVNLQDPLLKKRTKSELRFISHPTDGCPAGLPDDLQFWLFWAAKEAVFKVHRLQTPFSPKEISIEITSVDQDEFAFRGMWKEYVSGKIIVSQQEVLALATKEAMSTVLYQTYHLDGTSPSTELRTNFGSDVEPEWKLTSDAAGLPQLVRASIRMPVSFSHHYKSGAAAWLKLANGVE